MQEFVLSTRLCFGERALDALKGLGAARALLVTDRFFAQNGTAERVCALCGCETQIFAKVQPDPPLSLIAEGVEQMQKFTPDVLIALGGGSAIDCAKGMLSMSGSEAKFIAIPTSSGTGSEVTSFAILTHEGVKHPLVDEKLRPYMAILDNSLLNDLPKGLIADAGMDVIAHCVEAVAAKNASPFTQAMAIYAYRTASERLPRSFDGDSAVRGAIHCAATMAGIAFDNAGLGACHALSHALGGAFHIAHGRLNGILLPHVIQYNMAHAPYSLLAPNLRFAVTRLRKRLQLPDTLTAAGLKREDVLKQAQSICEAAMHDPCTRGNPREMTAEAYHSILRACL